MNQPLREVAAREKFCAFSLGSGMMEKGPMPPVACTVADPRLAQVIEVLLTEMQGWLMLTTCKELSRPPPQL